MIKDLEKFELHHIGCAVRSIEASLKTYRDVFGLTKISRIYSLDDMGINACFVELGNGMFLELIEPRGKNSVINTYLKKGINYYHLGYRVRNVDKVVAELLEKDFKEILSVNSPAFNNRKCVFLYTPELQMVEFIDSD